VYLAAGGLLGMAGLGVQCVRDEQHSGKAAQQGLDSVEQRREGGDSFDFVSTVTGARTMPVPVSSADSRCV
jgi:hypothetical protein